MQITAVMPTRGRPEWAKQALESFFAQTYEQKRIEIWDDEDEPSFPGGVTHQQVCYHQERIRYNIPEKMNKGCDAAKSADVIVKWDSDDWYAPTRIADQVERLRRCGKAVTAYYEILFHQAGTTNAFRYSINNSWGTGTSLVFLRSFWIRNRFQENKPVGSDNYFMRNARNHGQLDSIRDEGKTIVARIHDGNTSFKRVSLAVETIYYRKIAMDQLPEAYLLQEGALAARACK